MTRFIRSRLGIAGIFGVLATLLLMVAPALAQSAEKPRAPEMFRPITTHDSVQLKWWETADPAVLGISYEVQRRQGVGSYSVVSGSYGNYTHYQDGTVGISFTDSSVSPDTTYAYRVYAIQGGRRSDSPSRATITTKPAPTEFVEPVRAPELTPEPTVEAAQETTPELTPEPTVEPAQETTTEPTSETTVEPAQETTPELTPEPTVEPAQETTTELTSETTVEPAQETTTELTPDTQNDGDKQQQQDPDDAGEDDVVVQTNEEPSKIEDIDGGQEDPTIESPGLTRSETTSTSITLEWTAPAAPWRAPSRLRRAIASGRPVETSLQTTTPTKGLAQRLSQTLPPQPHRTPYGPRAEYAVPLLGCCPLRHRPNKTPGLISQRMSFRTDPANNAPSSSTKPGGGVAAGEMPDVRVTWTAAQRVATGCPVTKHVVTKNSRGGDRGTKDIGNVLFYVWPATGNIGPRQTYEPPITTALASHRIASFPLSLPLLSVSKSLGNGRTRTLRPVRRQVTSLSPKFSSRRAGPRMWS